MNYFLHRKLFQCHKFQRFETLFFPLIETVHLNLKKAHEEKITALNVCDYSHNIILIF